MTLNPLHNNPTDSILELRGEAHQEDEQEIVAALERYLRRASLAQAHPLPRWVMW